MNEQIEILVGDHQIDFSMVRVVKAPFWRGMFRVGAFITKPFLVDLDLLKISAKDLAWLVKNTTTKLLIRVSNEEKLKNLLGSEFKILYGVRWKLKFDLFECLEKIIAHKDRGEVYAYLVKHKPPIHLIYKWLVSNIEKFFENFELLEQLDAFIFRVSQEKLYSILAFSWVPVRSGMRLHYKFGKKGV